MIEIIKKFIKFAVWFILIMGLLALFLSLISSDLDAVLSYLILVALCGFFLFREKTGKITRWEWIIGGILALFLVTSWLILAGMLLASPPR